MIKRSIALFIIIVNVISLTGCWNYKEVDSLLIVAGVAFDRSQDGKYHLTVEAIDVGVGGKNTLHKPAIIETDGATIFDAVRNAKKMTSDKLYWSNCQIVILSQDIAKEGIAPALDFFMRNEERRNTIEILVSRENTAKEILTGKPIIETIVSFEIDKALETNAESLSTASYTQLSYIFNTLASSGKSLVLPVVSNTKNNDNLTSKMDGDAIFEKDKLIGFLSSKETRSFLFVVNEVKGGILTGRVGEGDSDNYSLEIFGSHTNVSHKYENEQLTMKIEIKTQAAISELETQVNYIKEGARDILITTAQQNLEDDVNAIIKKVQTEFGVDSFGFGESISKTDPKLWKKLKNNWNETFKTLKVEVKSDINLRNSILIKTPIGVGD